jgi:ABC-type bacteriocin/lantibiotic exporter with double-glycine peptidase domain
LYSSKLSDVIYSVKEVKLFDLCKKVTGEIDSKAKDLVLINIKRIFWGFTSGQFSVALQHIFIVILLGFLGCQVQQKIIILGQAIFIYSISDNFLYY